MLILHLDICRSFLFVPSFHSFILFCQMCFMVIWFLLLSFFIQLIKCKYKSNLLKLVGSKIYCNRLC